MTPNQIRNLCDFIDASPTACHAADSLATMLSACGASRLQEADQWVLEPGGVYYVVRGDSAVIAFRTGLLSPAVAGFSIAGAHTDSPALKARIDKRLSGKGIERVAVELYGSPIISTWMDRPLSLAGRVTVAGKGGGIESRLFNAARPIGVIPNLAIHLNREMNKGFEYNAQNHLPVFVEVSGADTASDRSSSGANGGTGWLTRFISCEMNLEPESILAADLFFVESQKAVVMGNGFSGEGSFLNGPRLDNLSGCHAILQAFLQSEATAHTQMACFLDAEEIGSRTPQGADSSLIRDIIARICVLTGCDAQGFYRALSRSFSVSVDVAQAWHPSYGEKFDDSFAPLLNLGPAVKANANFKYATDSESEAAFRLYCKDAGVGCQKFMTRSDIVPGSTIGPMSAALTGIKTVDVGHPLLSMHSIRETIGIRDHDAMIAAIARHFGFMQTFGKE